MTPSRNSACESIQFDSSAFEDLSLWAEQDRAQALRIVRLIRDVHLFLE